MAASLLVSGRIASAAGYEDIWARLGLGALAVGALRYRPDVQLWVTGLTVIGLALVAVTFQASVFLPSPDAAAFRGNPAATDLLSLPANLVRAVMLALAGATTALVILRARRLLQRAVTEASERASLARFLPAEIAVLILLHPRAAARGCFLVLSPGGKLDPWSIGLETGLVDFCLSRAVIHS